MEHPKLTPTLYQWAGGAEALQRLMTEFYRTVHADELLAPVFAGVGAEHEHFVALWFGEVFGGPPAYSEQRGGFRTMRAHHEGRDIAPEQRTRWVQLMVQAADTVGLPGDAEFRSAFLAYVEWASRKAMAASRPGAPRATRRTVPVWGWGEAPLGTD